MKNSKLTQQEIKAIKARAFDMLFNDDLDALMAYIRTTDLVLSTGIATRDECAKFSTRIKEIGRAIK